MSEDVWYEASRLLPPDAGKQALVKALTNMPKSKVLWIELCKREKDKEMKIKTLRKALNYISNDVELWRAAIELEDQEEAKSLLYKAIECVPYDTSIWIALAKLEEYEKARKVLNKAAKKIPTDHTLWVHAAKLEEAEGKYELVPKLIKKALKNLSGASNNLRNSGQPVVKITRDQWLKEAFEAEQSQSIVTARAIISETLYEGIEDKNDKEENKKNWTDTADNFLANGAIECSRAMHLCICKELKDDIRAWMNAINLEEKHGNIKSQGKILQQALEACNETELFYLIYAKHLWKKEKDIDKAIEVLQKGLSKITDEEELYLAIIKLYKEKRMFDDTRKILIKGRQI